MNSEPGTRVGQGNKLRILGVDPGLRCTGFGVIEQSGVRLNYIASGVIRSNANEEMPLRLQGLFRGLQEVAAKYQPQLAAVEMVFLNNNPQSTLSLGQARGTIICSLAEAGIPITEYTALQVKQAVVGQGKAAKQQVQRMVQRLLQLSAEPGVDAADALACAICHAHGSSGLAGVLSTRGKRSRAGRLLNLD